MAIHMPYRDAKLNRSVVMLAQQSLFAVRQLVSTRLKQRLHLNLVNVPSQKYCLCQRRTHRRPRVERTLRKEERKD